MNLRFAFLLLLICGSLDPHRVLGNDGSQATLPEIEVIVRRLIERAGHNLTNQHEASVTYYRTNVSEQYTSNGEVKERTDYVKRIVLGSGGRTSELILYNGRTPTAKEIERETEKSERRRSGDDDKDLPDRSEQIDSYMTDNILSRFIFTVHGRDVVDGRSCLLVGFKPGNAAEKSSKMFDRVIDQMGGVIWVDEEEYEMVKADIQLRERVKMWGGILASLDQISLQIERTRDDSGFWYDRSVSAHFSGRALTRHIDVMTWDFTSKPLPAPLDHEESIVAAH